MAVCGSIHEVCVCVCVCVCVHMYVCKVCCMYVCYVIEGEIRQSSVLVL